MADDKVEAVENSNKNGRELVRDGDGKVVSGVLNPNGRPKKGMALTDIMRQVLEEDLPDGRSRKEALVRRVLQLAYDGNESMVRLAWAYLEGMPVQKQEISGKDGAPIPILQLKEGNNVIPTDNSDKKDQPIEQTN